MGLLATQTLGPILDGLMRNTPNGLAFIERAERDGVRAAITECRAYVPAQGVVCAVRIVGEIALDKRPAHEVRRGRLLPG